MVSLPTTVPDGARCAEHPVVVAVGLCARCGNFLCSACAAWGSAGLCRVCLVRFGTLDFPFTRDNWTIDGVCNHAFGIWKRHWAPLAGVSAIALVASYALSFATGVMQALVPRAKPGESSLIVLVIVGIAFLFQVLVQAWMPLAMQAVALQVVRTGRVELDVAFRSITRLPQALLQSFLVTLPFLALGAVAIGLVIGFDLSNKLEPLWKPLLWSSPLIGAALFLYVTGLIFMQLPLLEDPPLGPLAAIEASMRAVSGERPRVIVMAVIIGATMIAGFLLCCVGMVFTMGLANLMLATLYLALKEPPDRADYTPPS
jgi:hypothetical protein